MLGSLLGGENALIAFRRILAVLCYILMLAADAAEVYVIYLSYSGGMTYDFGILIFIPIFIFSYWMATFFSQLISGRKNGKRIFPRALGNIMNLLGNLISLVLIGFWGYIYYMMSINAADNEAAALAAAIFYTGA